MPYDKLTLLPKVLTLAIGHEVGVGKDTFVRHMLAAKPQNRHYATLAFADAIYEQAEIEYKDIGFRNKAYYDANPATKHERFPDSALTPRDCLVTVGEGLKHNNPMIWVERLAEKAGQLYEADPYDMLIITDMRHPQEWWFLHGYLPESRLVTLRIKRGGQPPSELWNDTLLADYNWGQTAQNNNLNEVAINARIVAWTMEQKI